MSSKIQHINFDNVSKQKMVYLFKLQFNHVNIKKLPQPNTCTCNS